MTVLRGGPHDGREVNLTTRYIETPVACSGGMICRAVYEYGLFVGVDHLFEVRPDEYETRRESPEEWEQRTKEDRSCAPTNMDHAYGISH